MKALKSQSVQTLIIASAICTGMYWGMGKELTIPTIIASAFSALVVGNKVRNITDSTNGQYYDEQSQILKQKQNE